MKSYLVVFILGAVFLSTNASILEHIYNNTRLRGNVKLHTDDGLKLDYDGGASIFGLEIAKVGGNIKAVPKYDLVGNSTNGSVDYSGNIQIQSAKGDANVDVNGTAGLWAEWEKQTANGDGSIGYNATVWNRADWNVDAGNASATGKSGGAANVSGRACKNGSKAFLKKRFGGFHWASGNVTGGDNDTHTFSVHSFGRGGLKKKFWINDKTELDEEVTGPFPKVAYGGVAGVEKAQWIEWDDTKIQNAEKSGAIFSGLVWAEKGENNDTWISNVKHAKNADFGNKGYTIVDGDLVALYGGKGTVGEIVAAQVNVSKDLGDVDAAVFKTGDLHYVGVVVADPQGDKEQIQKEMLDVKTMKDYDLGQDFSKIGLDENNKGGKGVVTYLRAGWAGGKGVNAHVNDDSTIDVDSKGGAVWHAAGVDSKHKKPWHKEGGHGFNSSFVIDPKSSTVKNIQVQVERDPKKAEEITKMFERYGIVERRPMY